MRTATRHAGGEFVPAGSRFPDFFLIGHPKCGTTALYEMLRQHPQVFMSPVKEPFFFGARDNLLPGGRRMTLATYLALFAGAGRDQRLGEASTEYLRSSTAADEISAANPAARVIAILREPVSFVRSCHLHQIGRGRERVADLREALASEPGRPPWLRYTERVRYVEQLERYRAVFPAEQVLVLIYDDYRRANGETLRRVFGFLGVDEGVEVTSRERNAAADVRSRVAATAWRRLEFGRGPDPGAVRRGVKAATPRAVRHLVRSLYTRANLTAPPPVDEDLMAELRLRFAPEVRKASDYLGRDLCALWGYPDA